jgi:hypothetical protein
VSLINDALRKARQAASEHEAKQPEGAFRPAKAYPSRRSGRRGGPLAVALIAVAAGVIGASAAWWFLGDRQSMSTKANTSETRADDDPAPVATPKTQPTRVADRSEPDSSESAADAVDTPTGPAPTESVATGRTDPLPTPIESTAPTAASKPLAVDPNQERIFDLEARLGYASLSLGYIIARRDNPFAEINGIEVRVGSEVDGFVVEAIETDRVVLRDDKGPLVLRVP